MTTKQLHNRWLRTKRHLRSVGTSRRALRDADRALAEAARAAQETAQVTRSAFVSAHPSPHSAHLVWRLRRLNLSDITWTPAAAMPAPGPTAR